jgi:hypothetical protein
VTAALCNERRAGASYWEKPCVIAPRFISSMKLLADLSAWLRSGQLAVYGPELPPPSIVKPSFVVFFMMLAFPVPAHSGRMGGRRQLLSRANVERLR